MTHHVWINPTALSVAQGNVAWIGNVPAKGILRGYYAVCYTNALVTTEKQMLFRRFPVLFNDAFGAVFYSESRLFLGSGTADGSRLIYFTGDLFRQPVSIEEGMTSVDLTTVLPDLIDNFAVSGTVVGGTTFVLGTALLVEV